VIKMGDAMRDKIGEYALPRPEKFQYESLIESLIAISASLLGAFFLAKFFPENIQWIESYYTLWAAVAVTVCVSALHFIYLNRVDYSATSFAHKYLSTISWIICFATLGISLLLGAALLICPVIKFPDPNYTILVKTVTWMLCGLCVHFLLWIFVDAKRVVDSGKLAVINNEAFSEAEKVYMTPFFCKENFQLFTAQRVRITDYPLACLGETIVLDIDATFYIKPSPRTILDYDVFCGALDEWLKTHYITRAMEEIPFVEVLSPAPQNIIVEGVNLSWDGTGTFRIKRSHKNVTSKQ